ncbi:hypothetical protein MVEG_00209 [Podila verticillata NRRL 6337]|nr:hypothetical protein MVEG_00209 [Podila verticillata NRRL 6337]
MKAIQVILAVILVGQATACLNNWDCPRDWTCTKDNECRPRFRDDKYRITIPCNFDEECPGNMYCVRKLGLCYGL